MVVAFGENRLKPSEGTEFLEIDLVDFVECGADRSIDIEIASGKNGAGVEETS